MDNNSTADQSGGESSDKTELVPTSPKGIKHEDDKKLKEQSTELIERLKTDPDDRDLRTNLSNIGMKAQTEATVQVDLLKKRVGTMLKETEGPGAKIPHGLVDLRMTLDQINPHKLSQSGKIGNLLIRIPVVGWVSKLIGLIPGAGSALKKIAMRYETVQTQIDAVTGSLRDGNDMLLKDNIELDKLYQQVRIHQLAVQKNAYLGELLFQKLEEYEPTITDPAVKQKLNAVKHAVIMRVQDLRIMEQANLQFFVSIDMTINNNDMLSQSVIRTITVTQALLTVGLAIQSALHTQKKMLEATRQTQDYAAELLKANAAAIKQQTREIGDLHRNPVLALDKVKEAFDDLMDAMDEADRNKQAGVESARKGITQLTEMSSKLQVKADAIHAADKSERTMDSLEAAK